MTQSADTEQILRVLITIKTYPIPSSKYDELVCTAGVTDSGDFIRLYPINFRDLPFDRQFRKYQWIEVEAARHRGRDQRKESYRPTTDTIRTCGEPIGTDRGTWKTRSSIVLKKRFGSMEKLRDAQNIDNTSLGIFRPQEIDDLVFSPTDIDWKPGQTKALRQARIWEDRSASLVPPRKVPFDFHYRFRCDDGRCKGHKMSLHDWELGALFWRLVDQGSTHEEAAEGVRAKFLDQLCGQDKDTHFFVGTVLSYSSWIVLGLFYPKLQKPVLMEKQRGLWD